MQTSYVLARLGSAELAALIGGAIFLAIIAFFLLWGGLPKKQQ